MGSHSLPVKAVFAQRQFLRQYKNHRFLFESCFKETNHLDINAMNRCKNAMLWSKMDFHFRPGVLTLS